MNNTILFLGTSSGTPTTERNVTSIAINWPHHQEIWLLDCGEGTQQQLLKYCSYKIHQLRRIFITHMHGDHIFGLPGLISTLNHKYAIKELDIYGPELLKNYLMPIFKLSDTHLSIKLNFHAIENKRLIEENFFTIETLPLHHRVPAFGYRFKENDKPGQLLVEKLQAAGLMPGPDYAKIKQGCDIHLENGRVLKSSDYLGEKQQGKIIAYCSDTFYCDNSITLASHADIVIHESTYLEADLPKAEEYLHSTSSHAATVAKKAKAKRLILTHISSRYSEEDLTILVDEAKSIFENAELVWDGIEISI